MRFARHGEPGDERPLVSGADGLWRDLGTMTPTGLLAAEYGAVVLAGEELTAHLTEAERRDVVGANAAHTYEVTR